MLWVLKRTVSMRLFFWAPKTFVKTEGKKIFTIYTQKFCSSKPVLDTLDCKLIIRNMHIQHAWLKINGPACERIFEQTWHCIVMVLVSGLSLNAWSRNQVSSMLRCRVFFFYQKISFGHVKGTSLGCNYSQLLKKVMKRSYYLNSGSPKYFLILVSTLIPV